MGQGTGQRASLLVRSPILAGKHSQSVDPKLLYSDLAIYDMGQYKPEICSLGHFQVGDILHIRQYKVRNMLHIGQCEVRNIPHIRQYKVRNLLQISF